MSKSLNMHMDLKFASNAGQAEDLHQEELEQ